MVFKNKKLTFLALLSMMPLGVITGSVDVCLAAGKAVVTAGKAAEIIDRAYDLSECQACQPIAVASSMYKLGSLSYSLATIPYRLCFGFPKANNSSCAISLCDQASSALHGVSTLKVLCKEGYELVPDSIRWAVSSSVPNSVKLTCQKTANFIDKHTYLKLMALGGYVAYKTSLGRVTMVDTISNAYGEIGMIKMLTRLGYSLTPDCIKNAVPAPVKSKICAVKNFIDEHKIVKAAAFAGYVAYKMSQQNSHNAAYHKNQELNYAEAPTRIMYSHDQLEKMAMAITS